MSRLLTAALSLLILALPATAAGKGGASASLNDLTWLAGSWIERKPGGETEEYWMEPKGGMMLGLNRTVRTNGKTAFEYMRIGQTAKGISYFASPLGRPATEFPLTASSAKRAVFENTAHDFPQRIIYTLEADGKLRGRIEGKINGKERSQEWLWEKVK